MTISLLQHWFSQSTASLRTFSPSASLVKGAVIVGALYFSPYSATTTALLLGTGFLAKRTWEWKNSPSFPMPQENGLFSPHTLADSVNALYDDMLRCGLKGANRLVALKRFQEINEMAGSAQCDGIPSIVVIREKLNVISEILTVISGKPSAKTIEFHVDRLFLEMGQMGIKEPIAFQQKFNECLAEGSYLYNTQGLNKKLETIGEILRSSDETITSINIAYKALRLLNTIGQKGVLSNLQKYSAEYLLLRSKLAEFASLEFPFKDQTYQALNSIFNSLAPFSGGSGRIGSSLASSTSSLTVSTALPPSTSSSSTSSVSASISSTGPAAIDHFASGLPDGLFSRSISSTTSATTPTNTLLTTLAPSTSSSTTSATMPATTLLTALAPSSSSSTTSATTPATTLLTASASSSSSSTTSATMPANTLLTASASSSSSSTTSATMPANTLLTASASSSSSSTTSATTPVIPDAFGSGLPDNLLTTSTQSVVLPNVVNPFIIAAAALSTSFSVRPIPPSTMPDSVDLLPLAPSGLVTSSFTGVPTNTQPAQTIAVNPLSDAASIWE